MGIFSDFIFDLPVLVRVLASLLVILSLSRFFRELLFPLLSGMVFLALVTGHDFDSAFKIVAERLSSSDNLFLVLIILEVICLSGQMSECGMMQELVKAVRGRIPRRAAIAVLPAAIGLLPMPGGALFSAPLVDDCDPDSSVDALLKTRVNYWFRHVWEYWWPLYPGVLLAIMISGLETWRFVLLQLPMCFASIVIGYFFLLRRLPPHVVSAGTDEAGKSGEAEAALPGWWFPLSPIFVIIGVYLFFRLAFPGVAEFNRYLPMAWGIALAMILLQCLRPLSLEKWSGVLFSRRLLIMVLIVEAVRLYGAFIEADLPGGMPLVEQMRDEFFAWRIPPVTVVMLIPFLCGLTTGLSIGFVGASFPIVMSLLGSDVSGGDLAATTVLAFGFGYMGMILSPVHICLIVTNKHFQTDLLHSIRCLLLPALAMLVLITAYAWLLKQYY